MIERRRDTNNESIISALDYMRWTNVKAAYTDLANAKEQGVDLDVFIIKLQTALEFLK